MTIGLALLLVCLIPPSTVSNFSNAQQLAPKTFLTLSNNPFGDFSSNGTYYYEAITSLTPQQELDIILTCNDSTNVYLLNMNSNTLFRILNNDFTGNQNRNVTSLEEYLNSTPAIIVWEKQISDGIIKYTPPTIINTTLILSNPTQNTINVSYNGKILAIFVPATNAQLLGFSAVLIGFILATPWLINLRRYKKITSKKSKCNR